MDSVQTKSDSPSRGRIAAETEHSDNLAEKRARSTRSLNPAKFPSWRSKPGRFAFLIAFDGSVYHGSAIQVDVRTVEGDFSKALVASDLIPKEESISTLKYSRGSRVDRGVSATGLVVAGEAAVNEFGIDESLARINTHLPPEMRCLGITRVFKRFTARRAAIMRHYTYMVPEYLFCRAPEDILNHHGPGTELDAARAAAEEAGIAEEELPAGSSMTQLYADFTSYRMTDTDMERVRSIAKNFVGRHKFHNFTLGEFHNPDHRSIERQIFRFEPEFVDIGSGFRWVKFKIIGVSFIFAQIRKMIAALLFAFRGIGPEDFIQILFERDICHFHRAPGEFLVLEKVHYDENSHRMHAIDGDPSFPECDDMKTEFRNSVLIPKMAARESEGEMWLHYIRDAEAKYWFHDHCDPIRIRLKRREELRRRTVSISLEETK